MFDKQELVGAVGQSWYRDEVSTWLLTAPEPFLLRGNGAAVEVKPYSKTVCF